MGEDNLHHNMTFQVLLSVLVVKGAVEGKCSEHMI